VTKPVHLDDIRSLFVAFDSSDIEKLATLVTHDVRLQLMNNDVVEGHQAFTTAVGAFHESIAGVRHEILDLWVDGEVVIAELRVHYTRHDGGRVTLPCCNVFRLRGGCIYDYRSYMDISPVYA
jgi:ketosteroid isomerase-like protein